jgi:hypothetical protein
MHAFLRWLRGVWIGTPTPRARRPRVFDHRPCRLCARLVAHTRAGSAWPHTCQPKLPLDTEAS